MWGPSLIALIATPDRYHMKPVRVVGFAKLEFEGNLLYVGRADFEADIPTNAVWIAVPDSLVPKDSTLWRGYYIVEGRFRADIRGHFGLTSGTIDSITRFERWASRSEVEEGLKHFEEILPPGDRTPSPKGTATGVPQRSSTRRNGI